MKEAMQVGNVGIPELTCVFPADLHQVKESVEQGKIGEQSKIHQKLK